MAELKKIGEYELLEPVAGGTHSLYKAKAPDGRIVALKAIALSLASDEHRERFLREAEIAKTLDHPNLLGLIDSGADEKHLYQVMELLEGSDLHHILAQKTPMAWDQRMRIMVQVCDGLGYAHARGLVHRDLKPANLFLENSGRLRILDFGMARIQDSNLTRAGIALGTLNYMAPEQLRAERCSSAADVFSCGIIFYQLISGQHPFSGAGGGLDQLFSKMLFQAPTPLRELVPDLPPGIENVINQALEKDPAQRPQNASELRGMLRAAFLTGAATAAAPAASNVPAQDLGATRKLRRAEPGLSKPSFQSLPQQVPAVPPAPAPPKTTAPVPQAEKLYCPACAKANAKGAVVCTHCGSSLMATGTKMRAMQQPAKKNNTWMIALAAGGLAIGALVLFLLAR